MPNWSSSGSGARESWQGDQPTSEAYQEFLGESPTAFLGYQTTEDRSRVMSIVRAGQSVKTLEGPGTEAEIILDQTPFYAESGGQVGDIGTLTSPTGAARVIDTFSPSSELTLHRVEMEVGRLAVGDEVESRVDVERRRRIAANHTGTHLLHAALRDALGVHVKQAGSLVAPDRLRFDYTHYTALSEAEIEDIEHRINRIVLENHAVETEEMELNAAIESGADRFFWGKIPAEGPRGVSTWDQHGTLRWYARAPDGQHRPFQDPLRGQRRRGHPSRRSRHGPRQL